MKKKVCVSILALLLAFMLVAPALAETVKLAYSGGTLSLRKGPGTNYGRNGYVYNGDSITVLSKGSVWSEIEVDDDGRTGYIKNLYIKGDGDDRYADGTSYYGTKVSGKIVTKYASSKVNMRAGASTGTKSIASLKSGTKLTVLGTNGSFYLVATTGGTQGYVHKSYVSKGGSSSSSTTTKTAKVTGAVVNMRKGAGTKYAIVTALTKGTQVTVLNKNNSKWWKVQYKSYVGYMSSNYLK